MEYVDSEFMKQNDSFSAIVPLKYLTVALFQDLANMATRPLANIMWEVGSANHKKSQAEGAPCSYPNYDNIRDLLFIHRKYR